MQADRPRPPVDVALATYNGERFLPELLASIADQRWPGLRVIAGDDGSSDDTVAILQGSSLPIDLVRNGRNLGPRENFSAILARTTAPYVALADQDDVWMPDKLDRLHRRMRDNEERWGTGTPMLVYSDLRIVDTDRALIAPSFFVASGKSGHASKLQDFAISSHVPGCAMIANRALIDMALPVPADAHMHDWWLCLVAAACGVVDSVDEPLVLFRRHGANATGAGPTRPRETLVTKAVRRLRRPFFHALMHGRWWRQWAGNANVQLATLLARYRDVMHDEARTRLLDLLSARASRRWRALQGGRLGESRHDALMIVMLMGTRRARTAAHAPRLAS